MNSRWKNLLDRAGAVFGDNGEVLHFGNPQRERRAAMSGSVISDLSWRSLIRAEGPDTITFLQGQFTNDASRVDAEHSQLTGYCTPKGRLLAIFRVFAREDAWYLGLPANRLDVTLERLRKFVLMSKVTLEPDADVVAGIGLSGPNCAQELRRIVEPLPDTVDSSVQSDGLTVIRVPGSHPRFEIHGPVDAMEKAWARLDVHAAPVGASVWAMLDILAGVPEVWPETAEEFIPQSLNLDLLNAVNFEKGCYTGQEIIARLHYRGTVKRRMYLAACDRDQVPPPGEAVFSAAGGEQSVGQVVSAAPAPEGGILLLVSIALEHATSPGLSLGSPEGPALELRDLPYLKLGEHD